MCIIILQGISTERSKVDPWTQIAKYHLKAENAFKQIEGSVHNMLD